MTRVCVFCGGAPTTQEHVWPDWAARLVSDAGALPHYTLRERQGEQPVPNQWVQEPFSMTVKVVCRHCNNGWMSQLEDRVHPVLSTMLHGRGRALHETGQRDLATWALKTGLMAEHTQPVGSRPFPRRLYEHLFERGAPPDDLRIWMASYIGEYPGFLHVYGLDIDDRQDADRDERDIYGATVGLGPVVFQLHGSTHAGVLDAFGTWPWPLVRQIWPYAGSSFDWAPSPTLASDQLVAFANAIPSTLLAEAARARRRQARGPT